MEALIGKTIGGYKLDQAIGSGPTGQVYRGKDSQGHPAALKIIHPSLSLFTKVESYWTELQKVAQLSHSHITVPISADWSKSNRYFLVMEYLSGMDLHRVLGKCSKLPAGQVLLFAGQICLALEAVHARGIVHGAVKPHNIFLVPRRGESGGFSTQLLDFATCHLVSTHKLPASVPGMPGSPEAAYLAPEQFKGKATKASDIYTLGVVLYEALLGRRPFVGSYEELAAQHTRAEPELPHALAAGLAKILKKTLAKAPEDRFSDVSTLREALETWAASRPSELETPPLRLFAKEAGDPDVLERGPAGARADKTDKTDKTDQTIRMPLNELPAALEDTEKKNEKEEAKHVATEKERQAAPTAQPAKVPEDKELAAIAEKVTSSLRVEKEKKPTRNQKGPRPVVESKAGGAPAEPEGFVDEDDDLVELPLEKSVKAYVANLLPVVAPPSKSLGGNGESLDAALDEFVLTAKTWGTSLPQPLMDDRQIIELAKAPVEQSVAIPVEGVGPLVPPPPPRSLFFPVLLAFVLGGVVVFAGYKLLALKSEPPSPTAVEGGAPSATVQVPKKPEASAPHAGPVDASVTATALDAGAATSAVTVADAKAVPAADASAGAPAANADAALPKLPPKKQKKAHKAAAKKAKPAAGPVKKPAPKKGGKPSSDWVDPFSQ